MWKRTLKIVTHTDFDGICCASLFLRKFGTEIDILYSTINQAKKLANKNLRIDYICDLPKIGNAINIDHHRTNYENLLATNRLTEQDIVDPDALSATDLVYSHLSFTEDLIAQQIWELGHLADQALLPDEYRPLDLVLNMNSDNPIFLRKISELLAELGKDILKTEWLEEEHKKVISIHETTQRKIFSFLDRHPILPRFVIIDTREIIPGKLAKGVFGPFFKQHAAVIALVYKKNVEEPLRVSFRVSKSEQDLYDVSLVASYFGGGGHRMAAACNPKSDSIPTKLINQLKTIAKSTDTIDYFVLDK